MARRVEDPQSAEDRQLVAFVDRIRVGGRPGEERDERPGREVRDHFAEPDAEALGIAGCQRTSAAESAAISGTPPLGSGWPCGQTKRGMWLSARPMRARYGRSIRAEAGRP